MWKPELFKNVPFCRDSYKLVRDTHECFFGFFDRQIQRHLAQMEQSAAEEMDNSMPFDFMEAFLREKLARDARGEEHSYRSESGRARECTDFYPIKFPLDIIVNI